MTARSKPVVSARLLVALCVGAAAGAIVVGVLIREMARNSPRNVLTAAAPADVLSFEIRDKAGAVIWCISSDAPFRLRTLRYGGVPAGFRQVIPAGGRRPRALVDGEALATTTYLVDSTLEHRGYAVGKDGFQGGAWLAKPRKETHGGDGHNRFPSPPR